MRPACKPSPLGLPLTCPQVIGATDADVLLAYLGANADTIVNVNASEWVPRILLNTAQGKLTTTLFGDSPINQTLNTTGELQSSYTYAALLKLLEESNQVGVCMLGVFVQQMVLSPPATSEDNCITIWSLQKHAAVLRLKLSERVECGMDYRASLDIERLEAHMQLLAHLEPLERTRACLQANDFIDGLESAISLPAKGLRDNLDQMERLLEGLQDIWEASRSDPSGDTLLEVTSLAGYASSGFSELLLWEQSARSVIAASERVSGLFSTDAEASPGEAVIDIQNTGSILRSILEELPAEGLPEVAYDLKMLQKDMHDLFPFMSRAAHALQAASGAVIELLSKMTAVTAVINTLDPEVAFRVMDSISQLDDLNFSAVDQAITTTAAMLDGVPPLADKAESAHFWLNQQSCDAGDPCLVDQLRQKVDASLELIASRKGSLATLLAQLPDTIATLNSVLLNPADKKAGPVALCATDLTRFAEKLPVYLKSLQAQMDEPLALASSAGHVFFYHVGALLEPSRVDSHRTSLALVQNGKNITSALLDARLKFTRAKYANLLKQMKKITDYVSYLDNHVNPPQLQDLLAHTRQFLRPSSSQLDDIETLFPVSGLLMHLQRFPTAFIAAIGDIPPSPSKSMQHLAPDTERLKVLVAILFPDVRGLLVQMVDLSQTDSFCLRNPSCLASVQTRVYALSRRVKELKWHLTALARLSEDVKPLLVTRIQTLELFERVAPEIEIWSSWAHTTQETVPHREIGNSSSLHALLEHAICKESRMRVAIGLELQADASIGPCHFQDDGSEGKRVANPLIFGLDSAAETAELFLALMEQLELVQREVDSTAAVISEQAKSSATLSDDAAEQATSLTSSFLQVMDSFDVLSASRDAVAGVIAFVADARQAETAVRAVMSGAAMTSHADKADLVLQRSSDAPTRPFDCRDVPQECADLSRFVGDADSLFLEFNLELSQDSSQLPQTLLVALGQSLCTFQHGMTTFEGEITQFVDATEKNTRLLLQGPEALRGGDSPQCAHNDRFCLAEIQRSDITYRKLVFPLLFLQFWSLGAPPLGFDYCGTMMERRFTVPGLFSQYALQSSTFLQHVSTWPIVCERYTHLLAYVPMVSAGCNLQESAFFASLDPFGAVAQVSPIILPTGDEYRGSLDSLAVARQLDTVFACGRTGQAAPWMLYSFPADQLEIGWNNRPAPFYVERPIRACSATRIHLQPSTGKPKCLVAWDKMRQLLWIGNTARQGEPGVAKAYELVPEVCADGSSGYGLSEFVRAEMHYGPLVVSFAFTLDILGDEFVSLARCDNFGRNERPCKLDFHRADRMRNDLKFGNRKPLESLRVPSGIGSVVSDTSLGVRATAGGFFHISYVGTTVENIEWTERTSGHPEDRVFVFRVPILQTGIRKSIDRVAFSLYGVNVIPGGLGLMPILPTEPNPADTWPQSWERRLASSSVSPGMDPFSEVTTHGRRLQDEDCLKLDFGLPFPIPAPVIFFGFDLGLIFIHGKFLVQPTLEAKLVGSFCVDDLKVTMGVEQRTGFRAKLDLSAAIRWFIKGDLILDGSVMQLQLMPTVSVNAKSGLTSGRLDVGIQPLVISVSAGVYFPTLKFCKFGGCCCFGICVYFWLPCGLQWGGRNSWNVGRLSLGGTGRPFTLFGNDGDSRDRTPPLAGKVTFTQQGQRQAAVAFGGFKEKGARYAQPNP